MYPLVVSDLPINDLTDAIQAATGTEFVPVPKEQTSVNRSDGSPLLAGEVDGRSYLLDLHAAAIAHLDKLLLEIARSKDCLILSATIEAPEHCCRFLASRGDTILRLFWHNPQIATKDYSVGKPLDTESTFPLSARDGSGLTAALRTFDFHQMDYGTGFHRTESDYVLNWAPDYGRLFDEYGQNGETSMNISFNTQILTMLFRSLRSVFAG